jgi:hypothetical protein
LIVAGAATFFARRRLTAPRGERVRLFGAVIRFLLFAVVAGLLFWPLQELSRTSIPGRILVAVAGLAAGFYLAPPVALAGAFVYALPVPTPGLLVWYVIPALAGEVWRIAEERRRIRALVGDLALNYLGAALLREIVRRREPCR